MQASPLEFFALLCYNRNMFVDLSGISPNQTIAAAVSGGQDSMALLHFLNANAKALRFNIVALNVEHGIRGTSSLKDTEFVKSYCKKNNIPLLTYSVNAIEKSEKDKISLETAARTLRYECFYSAIKDGKCDKVATAHHRKDNFETVLFNLFRGTGIKGLIGIKPDLLNNVIRPFLSVTKSEIEKYVAENSIPFVSDETNFSLDYTRNAIRLTLIPEIEKIFPDAENAVTRLSETVKLDEEFLDLKSDELLSVFPDRAEITIPAHYSVFARAVIKALKSLGVKKDWEKTHIDGAFDLIGKQNGAKTYLLSGITANREYDKITLVKEENEDSAVLPFKAGTFEFSGKTFKIEPVKGDPDLKNGLYVDRDKIPDGAVIRRRAEGDRFKKFGGGTKSLGDYLTDKKVAKRIRDTIPVIANGEDVLAIFGVAVSDKVKVDGNTRNILKLQ